MNIRKGLKKFWEDHHEAVIVGAIGFGTNVATYAVASKVIKTMNGMRPYYYEIEYPGEQITVPIELYEHQLNGHVRHASTLYHNTDPRYVPVDDVRRMLSSG